MFCLHVCIYSFTCMCVSVCMCLLRAEEGTRTPGGTGATGGFEPPNKGAGHQTWAPWKSRNHVSSPILLLPFSSERPDLLICPQTLLFEPWAWHRKNHRPYSRAIQRWKHHSSAISYLINQEFHCLSHDSSTLGLWSISSNTCSSSTNHLSIQICTRDSGSKAMSTVLYQHISRGCQNLK